VPIQGLRRPDAQTILFFLSTNMIMFSAPTADPWYNSSQSTLIKSQHEEEVHWPIWYAAEAASPLGCATQTQYCVSSLPAGKDCTPLSGNLNQDMPDQLAALGVSSSAMSQIAWFRHASRSMGSQLSYIGQMQTSLLSRESLHEGVQGFLPPDQWQREVRYWSDISMAATQQALFVAAVGHMPDYEPILRGPQDEGERQMCASQKIICPNHVSFSGFGLAFIAAFGLLTLVVSLTLEPTLHWIRERYMKRDKYARLEWYSTGTLQLQRLAHEEPAFRGSCSCCKTPGGCTPGRTCTVTWLRGDKNVPINMDNAILAGLDISDGGRPLLRRSQLPVITTTTTITTTPATTLTPKDEKSLSATTQSIPVTPPICEQDNHDASQTRQDGNGMHKLSPSSSVRMTPPTLLSDSATGSCVTLAMNSCSNSNSCSSEDLINHQKRNPTSSPDGNDTECKSNKVPLDDV